MEELELNKIHNIDCLEFMKTLPDKCIDLVLTDPPYGIGMDGGNVGYKGFNDFTKMDWDKTPPEKEYFDEIFRISKNQIIFGGNYFGLPRTRCFIVWDKGEGFKGRTYAECEYAWTSFDKNAKIFKHDPLARGDYRGKLHPTQKPIELFKWLIDSYSIDTDIIFDPFLGSGTTALACKNLKRNYIGCEISKEYCDIAQKRLDNTTNLLF